MNNIYSALVEVFWNNNCNTLYDLSKMWLIISINIKNKKKKCIFVTYL